MHVYIFINNGVFIKVLAVTLCLITTGFQYQLCVVNMFNFAFITKNTVSNSGDLAPYYPILCPLLGNKHVHMCGTLSANIEPRVISFAPRVHESQLEPN